MRFYRSYIGPSAATFDRIGGDARVNHKNLSVAGGYIYGNDDSTDEEEHIWFAEAYYFVFPWLIPCLRYENMDVNHAVDADQAKLVVGSAILIRANIRVNVEGMIYTRNQPAEAAGGEVRDDDQIAFLLDWAF
jgi:hypothetical protein